MNENEVKSEIKIYIRKLINEIFHNEKSKYSDLLERIGLLEEVIEGEASNIQYLRSIIQGLIEERRQWKEDKDRIRKRMHEIETKPEQQCSFICRNSYQAIKEEVSMLRSEIAQLKLKH
jgi:regulator of replication initiation timing